MQHKIEIVPWYPTQTFSMGFVEYSAAAEFFYSVQGWLQDHLYDFLNVLTQDMFITGLCHNK